MKTTINLLQFRQAFFDMGRHNQFSSDGLRVLFESLEQYEDDTGEQVELDVIALCCEYSEEDHVTIAKEREIDISDCDFEDALDRVISYLEDEGVYVGVTDAFNVVYRQY